MINIDDIDLSIDEQPVKNTCKGLTFRGYNNKFQSGKHIGNHQGIKLLKRKSCPGCQHCEFYFYNMQEMIDTDTIIWPEIEHGKLYSIRVVNISKDWETGIVDDYDYEIFKLEERL